MFYDPVSRTWQVWVSRSWLLRAEIQYVQQMYVQTLKTTVT
jgi:hypothetical protein